jgi:hypothetical protein
MIFKICERELSGLPHLQLPPVNANEIDPRSRLGFHLDDKRKLIPTGRCEVGIAPKLILNVKFSEFTFESDRKS